MSKKYSNFAPVIELERHIEILLLDNDCVIVPGLGGFMAHHVEARYEEDEQAFLPPLRTLGFNPQLKINDSLLAQSYIEAYDISYPEALQRIEDEVNELTQILQNEGRYELNNIGIIELNEDGNYVFTPCEAGILTPTLYGLSSFEMKPIKAQAVIVAKEKTEEKPAAVISIPSEEAPAATEVSIDVEEEPEEEERAIVIKMSWVRNAVAVAAAVLAFFLMTTPVTNSENSQQISHLNNPMIAGMLPKDSNMEKITIEKKVATPAPADTMVFTQKVQQEPIAAKTDITPANTEKPAKRYCIVLASYVSKKNAHAFVEELKEKGYKESEVFIRNDVTRVIYGNFKTANDAYNKLQRIQKQKGLEEAWVMKI